MSIAFDIRHLGGTHELELFNRIPYALNDEIADDLEQGRRRAEWTWLAIHEDRLLGRLALWSPSGATDATQLDLFDLDDALSDEDHWAVGAALLDAARSEVIAGQVTPPEFARYLPADWRERPAERRATETIMAPARGIRRPIRGRAPAPPVGAEGRSSHTGSPPGLPRLQGRGRGARPDDTRAHRHARRAQPW